MTEALTDITGAVTSFLTIATTGNLAIFFWAGVAGIAIGIIKKFKH